MSEPPDSQLADLTGITLERIARLCDEETGLDPDDIADRPVLRAALLRVRQEAEREYESFAGFNDAAF